MIIRRFLQIRQGFRHMHPEWSAPLHNMTALGYVYGHVYGDVALMDRVVALATRYTRKLPTLSQPSAAPSNRDVDNETGF